MNVQVPRGVDWSATYCRPATTKKPKSRKYQDLNAYFISSIIASGGRTTVHTSTLRSLFGGDYRKFIQSLESSGLISVNPSYVIGERAKEFTVNANGGLTDYTITDGSTIRQIKKARVRQLRFTLSVHPHLRREFDFICSLSFDLEGATRFLRETYKPVDMVKASRWVISNYGEWGVPLIRAAISNDRRTFKGLSKKLKLTGTYRARLRALAEDYRALKTRLHEAEKWNLIQTSENKEEYISISYSQRTGRVHSNLTSTPKNIRKFLTLQGEPLVEVDASNCQWALLMSYERFNLKYATIESNKKVLKTFKETRKGEGGLWSPTTHQHPNTILLHILEKEYKSIVSQLESGYFRENLHRFARETTSTLNRGAQRSTQYQYPKDERDTKHRLISRVLFDRPDAPYVKEDVVVIAFKKLYPNAYQRIQQLKSTYWREVAGGVDVQGKPYASLAIRLQRAESEVFHGLFGEIPILHGVIHDCVLVKSSDAVDMVKQMKTIAKEYNLTLPLSLNGEFVI